MKSPKEVMADVEEMLNRKHLYSDKLVLEVSNYIVDRQQEAIAVGQTSAPGETFDAHALDAFARAALTGLMSTGHSDDQVSIVEEAFEIAQQCLVERKKVRTS